MEKLMERTRTRICSNHATFSAAFATNKTGT